MNRAVSGWLRGEFLRRVTSAGMLWMAAAGCALGFRVRGLPVLDGPVGNVASWVATGAMILGLGLF